MVQIIDVNLLINSRNFFIYLIKYQICVENTSDFELDHQMAYTLSEINCYVCKNETALGYSFKCEARAPEECTLNV